MTREGEELNAAGSPHQLYGNSKSAHLHYFSSWFDQALMKHGKFD